MTAPQNTAPKTMAELAAEYGLAPNEYQVVLDRLGREPNHVELGVFSVMWSEHCSYKSSKIHLGKFPTKGPRVICGPGENAGVIDIDDGDACIFKMESHNHPSFIEPYQGAATGVGGIMRDVFTMGARPVALLNALRFGDPSRPWPARPISTGATTATSWSTPCASASPGPTPCSIRPRPRRAFRWSISAPRPVATASTARPCPRPSLTTNQTRNARRSRSAIPSPRSC